MGDARGRCRGALGFLVGWREKEAIKPPEVLTDEGVIGRGMEVAGRPPEFLAGEGGGRLTREGRPTAA